MAESEWLAKQFEGQRGHLRAVAYRMLGSLAEADDAVQDAWLRASRAEGAPIENMRGWLTTIVARVSLNMLRARRTHREESLGAHLPDPVVTGEGSLQPEEEALLADSVGLALLVANGRSNAGCGAPAGQPCAATREGRQRDGAR